MSAAARLMTDTAAICSRTLGQPLVPEYMIKDIKLIMAAGIIPAAIFYTESGFFSGGEDRVSPTVQIPEIVLKTQERTHEQSYVNQYFHRKIVWRNICRCRVFSGESALDGENVLIFDISLKSITDVF